MLYFWLTGLSAAPSMKSMQYPSTGLTGRPQVANRGSLGAFATNEPAEATSYDPLIGRKVWTRWPEDNHFYEAVITDYNPVEVQSSVEYKWSILVIIELPFNIVIFYALTGKACIGL